MPDQTQSQPQYTPQQFAAKIKEKYPAYANMADDQLVSKITEKYPQYKASIKVDTSAERGAAQATGLRAQNPDERLLQMMGMSKHPEILHGEGAAGVAAGLEGGRGVTGLIAKAFKPAVSMVPVVSKLLDAQGNPIVREVEQVGQSAAGRAVGIGKEAAKKIITWMNANPMKSYLILRTAEELGIGPHKALKMVHIAGKE